MAILSPDEFVKVPPRPSRCKKHGSMQRIGIGPTGRKQWMILVDRCNKCGLLRPIKQINYEQRSWVRRMNRSIK